MTMKDLLRNLVRALVEHPEQIKVDVVEGKHTLILTLKVAKEDMGKVIGKQGRNAAALRTILTAASGKEKKRIVLEIID
jgi:predicted RNA-binding protein YlqC (UPF0109 family)